MPVVEVSDIRRSYRTRERRPGLLGAVRDLFGAERREVVALDGVSLRVEPGEILGFIGANGAGKSTTIKCVTGILKPDAGTIRVCGLDPWAQRQAHVRNIGVVFGQRTQLWWDLAVIEAFDLLAAVFEVPDADYRRRLAELCELLALTEPLLHTPVRQLSLGQRVRCDLAAALLHGPKVLLLDEPTIGLDVAVKQRIRSFIRHIARERQVAVLLTTHDLSDIEELCERVVLVDAGRTVFDGPLTELRALGGKRRLTLHTNTPPTDEDLAAIDVPGTITRDGPATVVVRFATDVPAAQVVAPLMAALDVEDLSLDEPGIEEVVARLYEERP